MKFSIAEICPRSYQRPNIGLERYQYAKWNENVKTMSYRKQIEPNVMDISESNTAVGNKQLQTVVRIASHNG